MNDKRLIHNLKKKNEKSLMVFIERFSPYVCTIIRNVSNHSVLECDVEEIASDVFVKIWNNSENLKSETIRAYLAIIARNQTIDYLRKHKHEVPFEDIELTDTIDIEEETVSNIVI